MTTVAPTPDQLIAELHRLGIRHLATMTPSPEVVVLSPHTLITGLATCKDARVRAALVPLFLWRPDHAAAVRDAAAAIASDARAYLQCSYSVAVALQPQVASMLVGIARPAAPPLPNHFAIELGLTANRSPEARLAEVARRHAQLSGEAINWRGTYEHAVAAAVRFAAPETAWSR